MEIWFEALWLSSPYLVGLCLAVCALITVRAYILFWMADDKPPLLASSNFNDNATIVLSGHRSELRPVEFAYLMRGGDSSHAMAVLVVDLLQRAAKRHTSAINLPLADYELKMWEIVKGSLKTWAAEKKEAVLLESFKKDPVAYVRRWSGIYLFLKKNFKPFVSGVAKDPRHLRKYFSFGGVVKLLADFSTAGYQQAFERELKSNLLNRGLIVADARKAKASAYCLILAVTGIISGAMFSVFILHSCSIFIFAIIIAAVTRAIMFVKQLIPYYIDVLNLFGHIHRGGIRVALFKALATFLNNAFYAVSISFFLVGIFCLSLYIRFYSHGFDTTSTFILSIALSVFLVICFDVALSSWRVSLEEWPTARGRQWCGRIRQKISAVSPLDQFKNVLQNPDYDETFSDVMGLYGIETLFFLA